MLEARVDYERFAVVRGGHSTLVQPFPIKSLGLGSERIIFGIDRLDYTKGIPDRLRAFERMLTRHPEWRERVVFVQVGAPSRDQLAQYKALGREVSETVASVNARYGTDGWRPVIYVREHRGPADVAAFYRTADVCVVSSLHDGMNLVAKEFIAARTDNRGVLVLSRFTGAARELQEAVFVNPFSVDEFADALHASLTMPEEQQERRMKSLNARIRHRTVYDWAAGILRVANGMVQPV
jgi:trehalose 6-phosphate synthase